MEMFSFSVFSKSRGDYRRHHPLILGACCFFYYTHCFRLCRSCYPEHATELQQLQRTLHLIFFQYDILLAYQAFQILGSQHLERLQRTLHFLFLLLFLFHSLRFHLFSLPLLSPGSRRLPSPAPSISSDLPSLLLFRSFLLPTSPFSPFRSLPFVVDPHSASFPAHTAFWRTSLPPFRCGPNTPLSKPVR